MDLFSVFLIIFIVCLFSSLVKPFIAYNTFLIEITTAIINTANLISPPLLHSSHHPSHSSHHPSHTHLTTSSTLISPPLPHAGSIIFIGPIYHCTTPSLPTPQISHQFYNIPTLRHCTLQHHNTITKLQHHHTITKPQQHHPIPPFFIFSSPVSLSSVLEPVADLGGGQGSSFCQLPLLPWRGVWVPRGVL